MFEVDLELVPKKTEESALSSKAPAWKGNCPGENLDSNQEEKQKLKVKKKKKNLPHLISIIKSHRWLKARKEKANLTWD